MERKIGCLFISIALLIYCFSISSQVIYYDAISLKNLLNNKNQWPDKEPTRKAVTDILSHYCKRSEIVKVFFSDNPYIRDFASSITNKSGNDFVGEISLTSITKSVGGLNITNLADGMGKFMVKRAKEEMDIAFFEHFKEVITDSKYADMQTLFPETYHLLIVINDQVYNYEFYIQSLRLSFRNDILNLPLNLTSILDNHPDFFKKHPELATLLNSASYIAEQIKNRVHPGEIISKFPINYLNNLSRNWKGSFQTLQLFSESLRDSSKSDSSYWVPAKDLDLLVSDPNTFKIYMGLIYQTAINKYDSVKFIKTSLVAVLNNFASKYDSIYPLYKKYVHRLGDNENRLSALIKDYKKYSNDSLKTDLFYNYVNAINNLIEQGIEIGNLINRSDFNDTLKPYIEVVRASNELMVNVNRKLYSMAIINVSTIIKFINLNYSDKQMNETFSLFLKYGTFMSIIVEAKSSDDVERTIESVALPAGSSSIKYFSNWSASLNAYVGGIYAFQTQNSGNHIAGVWAPLGIAFSRSTGWKNGIGSVSVFGSIIDIGSFATYRFTNTKDTLKALPEFTMQNIFAPGLNIVLGRLLNTPLSLSFGVQFGPAIRKITTNNATLESPVWRYNLGLSIDIPIFNFYAMPRK